ncbi:uncharacterized protein [Dysidea avara]|uniref:uncharacterized protein isoform X2 n=1 Tax=Dysidea avara TaxID=196820 RepID=UPI003333004B
MTTSSGGYDYEFVNTPPDRLVCNICHLPSRDPYLTTCCGHVFCKSCLDCVKNPVTVSKSVCPVCREEEFVTYINKQLDREIRNLHVTCTNKKRGCEWQGELNDINNHLGNSDGCRFEDVKCSNECGKVLQQRYLACHVETECPCRKVDCQYCHITGEHQFIEGEHKEQCPKLPLPCPNKCEVKNILREDMDTHRKECLFEMIRCEYHNVGCEERMMRKRKREHEEEKMEEHLSLTKHSLTQEVAATKLQLADALEKINTLNLVLHQALGHTSCFSGAGSHKKQVEPAVSDSLPGQSQSATSFSMATSYSDNVSTASSILSSAGLNDGVSQGVTQTSVSQPPSVDDVMATVTSSSAGQGANQIDVPAMSLGSGLTVAIISNVTVDSNMNTGTVTNAMSSLEPFNPGVSSVSSHSQSPFSSSWLSLGSSPSGKMTSPSYTEGMYFNTSKAPSLGPMTSLQQPITGKVSTTAPGIQPIMSKLLTEIANTSSVGSTSLSSTGGAAASTSMGGVEVKTEINTSLAVMSGTSLRMNSGTSSGMPSGVNTGANVGGISASGMGLGINTGMNSVVGTGGVGSRMNLGMKTGAGGFQMRAPGMNPGMGKPPSIYGSGMGPSSSIAMLTGMQQPPDIYPTPAGVGGAPSSAMVGQNAQAQQTQIIWTGSIEVSEMRDGLREIRTIRCSITSKVASKSILKPELWPAKMILQPYPQTIYQSVLGQLKSRSMPFTTTMVTFNFLEPVASINTLKMLTSAEQQRLGMVQLLGTQPMCPVKSIILSWYNQQFVGYVPSEQDKFLMVFRQTLQELQQGGSGGVPHSSGLPPSLQLPSNLPPKIQQLLERSKPEDQKIILEKVKQMRQFQQQQAQMAGAVGGGGAMVQPMRLQQASQPKGIIGQGNMIQPMGGGRQMQSQTIQIHSQPMGIQLAGQMQTAQPMGLQQGQYQNQPVVMPQSNPSMNRP